MNQIDLNKIASIANQGHLQPSVDMWSRIESKTATLEKDAKIKKLKFQRVLLAVASSVLLLTCAYSLNRMSSFDHQMTIQPLAKIESPSDDIYSVENIRKLQKLYN